MTNIIATIGPMIAQEKELDELTKRGVTNYWVNNGLKQSYKYIKLLNRYKNQCSIPITVFLDLPSTRCRYKGHIGTIVDDHLYKIYDYDTDIQEENNCIIMTGLREIISDLAVGEKIYYEDGLCVFSIKEINTKESVVTVVCDKAYDKGNRLVIKENSAVSFDGKDKQYSVLRKIDLEFLRRCQTENIIPDYVVLSFCKNEEDVILAKQQIGNILDDIKILVKIQTQEAVKRIDNIIECSDGIVVERGDLIYSLKDFSLPFTQKNIIEKARRNNKISVVASGFMSEYARTSTLNRAEQSDVYRLKEEGAGYLLLTKETGQSDHPIATVDAIRQIFTENGC